MNVNVIEILELSLLFVVPSAIIMIVGYGIFACVSMIKRGRLPTVTFNPIDLIVPIAATTLWCCLSPLALQTKSIGNLAEISVLGLIWGVGYIARVWLRFNNGSVCVWRMLLTELVLTAASALLAPTFPE